MLKGNKYNNEKVEVIENLVFLSEMDTVSSKD